MSVNSAQMQTVSNIESVQQLQENIQKNPGIIRQFLNELPDKAMNLGARVLIVLIVFFICLKLIGILRKIMKKALAAMGCRKNVINFLDTCLKWVMYVVLVLALLTNFGIDATSIVAFIGSLGLTIGLALQGSLSNLAGGVILLIMRPFEAGDYIKVCSNGIIGTVVEVQIFYTRIRTDENFLALIPNGTLANNDIINYSKSSSMLLNLSFGISYGSDIDRARDILTDILKKDPAYDTERCSEPETFTDSLEESSVRISLRGWVNTGTTLDFRRCKSRITEQVLKRFGSEGIVIPYPQLDVHKK